jgi:hypothetical protein
MQTVRLIDQAMPLTETDMQLFFLVEVSASTRSNHSQEKGRGSYEYPVLHREALPPCPPRVSRHAPTTHTAMRLPVEFPDHCFNIPFGIDRNSFHGIYLLISQALSYPATREPESQTCRGRENPALPRRSSAPEQPILLSSDHCHASPVCILPG